MYSQQDNWCSKEFSSIKLGDARLNRRLLKVARNLMNSPTEPIHAACDNWSEAKAAYRLFDNDKLQETNFQIGMFKVYFLSLEAQGTIYWP